MTTNVTIVRSEPHVDVVPLSKAKKQLRVATAFTEEDDLIEDYIDAAVEASEQYMGCHIYKKDMVITLDGFRFNVIFEAFPLRSVTSVKYWKDGLQVTMPGTDYFLTSQNLKQSILTFREFSPVDERHDAVEITLAIGYVKAADVPAPIKQAILLQVSDMFERREDRAGVILTAAQALMRPYRKYT